MEETLSSGESGGARSSGGQWLGFLPKHLWLVLIAQWVEQWSGKDSARSAPSQHTWDGPHTPAAVAAPRGLW